ncbi:PREDICTED: nose resistant to fluoxetine protein 6-like [Papilio xuthus]|uniref:Nose resistant to fluoxetine protein 6-like n=1 Tax=Papilio xuthus TaxID=66420 RepID=A0AAJ7E4K9_PAPXU|nr:PREDICTED: nose resistant to fluoxetine protein 6-like [Papilio xuthus]
MVSIHINITSVKVISSVIFLFITKCSGLTDMEYNRMPPIYHLDNYESCLQRIGDVYCTTHFSLVSESPSDLLDMIQEYSKDTSTHFNHSKLRYGMCLAESCSNYHSSQAIVSIQHLEACLNRTFRDKYNLQTRVTEFSCIEYNETVEKNFGDFCMGLIIFTLTGLAIFSTFLDVYLTNINLEDFPLLLNFSIRHNWRRLFAPYEVETDSKRQIFKSLHGIRVVLISLVILGHSRVPHVTTMKNLKLVEESYKDIFLYIFLNGNIIVQTYFVISGMLLVYKLPTYTERYKIDFHLIPKLISTRWLRLVPPHAFVIFFTATCLRHTKSGPLWEVVIIYPYNLFSVLVKVLKDGWMDGISVLFFYFQTAIGDDIRDCQQRGWLSLLYLNNFLYDAQCIPHTWHLAADMQLYCFGVVFYLVAKNKNNRNILLVLTLLVGLLIPGMIIYIRNLNPLIILSPTTISNFFGTDPTFNEMYRHAYTNVPSYAIGLALGYLIYDLQRSDFQIEKYKKYRYVYWALLPACFVPILLGSTFYGPRRHPVYLHLLYAIVSKPYFGLLVAIIIFGFVFKYENIYRGFFEWSSWRVLSRLSYCAFLVHFLIVRLYTASHTQLTHITFYTNLLMVTGFIISSLAVALPLWLLVEAPSTGLLQYYMTKRNINNNLKETLKSEKSKNI